MPRGLAPRIPRLHPPGPAPSPVKSRDTFLPRGLLFQTRPSFKCCPRKAFFKQAQGRKGHEGAARYARRLSIGMLAMRRARAFCGAGIGAGTIMREGTTKRPAPYAGFSPPTPEAYFSSSNSSPKMLLETSIPCRVRRNVPSFTSARQPPHRRRTNAPCSSRKARPVRCA